MTPPGLPETLARCLPPRAVRWLEEAAAAVREDPALVETLFPVVGRHCGRGPLPDPSPGPAPAPGGTPSPDRAPSPGRRAGPFDRPAPPGPCAPPVQAPAPSAQAAPVPPAAPHPGWTVDDAVRALLLDALPPGGPAALAGTLTLLYRHGDAAERRGVLRALAVLDRDGRLGPAALPLVEDAIRTNDPRLVSAALGGYAARHLGAPAYRQAVLKCAFTGIPLSRVAGLDERADAELARMLDAYARELTAAGRPVPSGIGPIVRAHAGEGSAGGHREHRTETD